MTIDLYSFIAGFAGGLLGAFLSQVFLHAAAEWYLERTEGPVE